MRRLFYQLLLTLVCLKSGICDSKKICVKNPTTTCPQVQVVTECYNCNPSKEECCDCNKLTCFESSCKIDVLKCSCKSNTNTVILKAAVVSLTSTSCLVTTTSTVKVLTCSKCLGCTEFEFMNTTGCNCNPSKTQCDKYCLYNNAQLNDYISNCTLYSSSSTSHRPTTPTLFSSTAVNISKTEISSSKNTSDKSTSLSGLAIGLIVAAVLIAAIIITLIVIWRLRYNCRVPAFLSRNDTIRSSTTALTSIENSKEQDGTVYEQIAEHPYNELEPSEENGLGYTEISCGPDSNVHSNTDQSDTYLANGRSGQPYSHLHEHSRELTHDYNMSQGTELSNRVSVVNHTINRNGSTPNYTLATVINENKDHTDAGNYNKGRLDNGVSLHNITEEDNLESEYDVPSVRKDQEKNPYFELENEPVTGQVTDDSLDTDYDVPPARKADPNMYFELQNTTETDQPTEDNGGRDYNDLNDASVNPYFQLENETKEDRVNRMDDYSDKSSSDGDHHSIGDTEPDGDHHSIGDTEPDGDGSLIGDYDVPPPRRENP